MTRSRGTNLAIERLGQLLAGWAIQQAHIVWMFTQPEDVWEGKVIYTAATFTIPPFVKGER